MRIIGALFVSSVLLVACGDSGPEDPQPPHKADGAASSEAKTVDKCIGDPKTCVNKTQVSACVDDPKACVNK